MREVRGNFCQLELEGTVDKRGLILANYCISG